MVSAIELCRETDLIEAIRKECRGVEIESELMASSLIVSFTGALLMLMSLEEQDFPRG